MRSSNGYPIIEDPADTRLRLWTVPGVKGTRARAQNGWAGFLLICAATWFNRHVERLDGGRLDDWFHAYRKVRAGEAWSFHAPGRAGDMNATQHPLGTDPRANFTPKQIKAIRRLVRGMRGVLRWGGDYNGRKDPMHLEIIGTPAAVKRVARLWRLTRTGRDVLAANPAFARSKGIGR